MDVDETNWLIGANGVFGGSPEGWQRAGPWGFPVNAILRMDGGLLAGSEGGLWWVPLAGDRWVQWHDETLTSVLSLANASGGVGVAVGAAYGIATGAPDDLGPPRWAWHSDGLNVNQRYTNALCVDPDRASRWVVGTEGGVLVWEGEEKWVNTSLAQKPVRGLCHAAGAFWAGTDAGGVWRSEDGLGWTRAGTGLDDVAVFSLAWTGDRLIVGTLQGVFAGDGVGRWVASGAPLRMRAVGASENCWLAGASPGGLWCSADAGVTWQKTGAFESVRTIVSPEEN